MFDAEITSDGSDLGDIVLQALSENPSTAAKAGARGAKYVKRLVTGQLKRTGFSLLRKMQGALKSNTYNLAPLTRHPANNAVMSTVIRSFFKSSKSTAVDRRLGEGEKYPSNAWKDRAPGINFSRLIQYKVFDDDIRIGVIPQSDGGRASTYWSEAFSDWQDPGKLKFPTKAGNMNRFLYAIGMPVTRPPSRQSRPFIASVERQESVADIFTAFLEEKLNKL